YTSIKLPKNLEVQISEITEKGGYRSVSDFVLEATRSHLREVRK
ncbi:MAG: ribbon-helix-helix protein, CopG family, partial [Bacteroidetes bacterium]|nr:ribbon-helix-helix protein, CopG family [Bacteroidota bacterium]